MTHILPRSPVQPVAWPALLIYQGEELSPVLAYVLSYENGAWQLSAHVLADLPNTTRPSAVQPIEVDAAADLRKLPPGTTTVVTSLPDES